MKPAVEKLTAELAAEFPDVETLLAALVGAYLPDAPARSQYTLERVQEVASLMTAIDRLSRVLRNVPTNGALELGDEEVQEFGL